ncbi:MutS protein msh5 [Dimargaris xerosporica]|nr:MutS protein msh5 [Dimargaris xerosporica]
MARSILSLAVAATKHRFIQPTLVNESYLDIEDGCMTSEQPLLMLVAPNGSGKSVYMHQWEGVFDKLLMRTKSSESISKCTSAFTEDLKQVVQAINECTARSLFLCDEFGKGTLVADGIGLLGASLRYFLDRPDTCPKIVAVTHFHELVASNVLAAYSDRILWCTMEVSITTDQPNEPVYLYRVAPGTTLSAWAYHIAQLAGVPQTVITLAQTARTWLGGEHLPSTDQSPRYGATQLRLTWPTSPSTASIVPADDAQVLSIDSD